MNKIKISWRGRDSGRRNGWVDWCKSCLMDFLQWTTKIPVSHVLLYLLTSSLTIPSFEGTPLIVHKVLFPLINTNNQEGRKRGIRLQWSVNDTHPILLLFTLALFMQRNISFHENVHIKNCRNWSTKLEATQRRQGGNFSG